MLGEAALQARLVVRPSGIAGLGVAIGGTAAIVAATRHWYVVTAEVTMLGGQQDRVVTGVPGLQVVTGGPWALVAGIVAVLLGLSLALDRHPGWTRPALGTVAVTLALSAALSLLRLPSLERFPDPTEAIAELVAVAETLPTGVELDLRVGIGPGLWTALLAAALIAVATAGARELATS